MHLSLQRALFNPFYYLHLLQKDAGCILIYIFTRFYRDDIFSKSSDVLILRHHQEFDMKHIEIRFGGNIEKHAKEEKSFNELFQSVNPMFCFSKREWKPQMDIYETRNEIVIQAEIAGVRKEDILIEVSSKAVKISGGRKGSQPDRTATYRLAEIQFGPFERILYLPSKIDVQRVSAQFSNGFLELILGKLLRENIQDKHTLSMDFT
jgi:HSP20 family protein